MAALKAERHIYMWHVAPRSSPPGAKAVPLQEILGILKASWTAGTAELYLTEDGRPIGDGGVKDPKNRIYIADISENPSASAVTILINRGDPSLADPAFIKGPTKKVRSVPPDEDESQGASAHLVISTAIQRPQNNHRACFERMPSVSSSLVSLLFQNILDARTRDDPHYVFSRRVKRGGKIVEESRPYRLMLKIQRVPADSLKEDIKKGELSLIRLISKKYEYAGPDKNHVVREVKQKVEIKPRPEDKSRLLNFIEELTPWAEEQGFDEIQFDIQKLPGGQSAQPRFALEQGEATETLYVRSQRIQGFGCFLEKCYASVCKELNEKMLAELNDSAKWQ